MTTHSRKDLRVRESCSPAFQQLAAVEQDFVRQQVDNIGAESLSACFNSAVACTNTACPKLSNHDLSQPTSMVTVVSQLMHACQTIQSSGQEGQSHLDFDWIARFAE